MIYDYECKNKSCSAYEQVIEKQSTLAKADSQTCDTCGQVLTRRFTVSKIPRHSTWNNWQPPL